MHPVQRMDSCKCTLWHKLAKNASILEKDMTDVMCPACKCLCNKLNQRLKKVRNTSSQQKEHRVKPSSHFPVKYLSPKSLKKKRQNMQQERTKLLKKYAHMEVSLSEDQHDEMYNIVDKVSHVGAEELESIFTDGDNHGVGLAIRELWKNYLQNIKKEFEEDQQKNGKFIHSSSLNTHTHTHAHTKYLYHYLFSNAATGSQRNRWSIVTIRLALAVYTRSPAAYDALKSFGLFQLPSRATLQTYTGAFRDEAG